MSPYREMEVSDRVETRLEWWLRQIRDLYLRSALSGLRAVYWVGLAVGSFLAGYSCSGLLLEPHHGSFDEEYRRAESGDQCISDGEHNQRVLDAMGWSDEPVVIRGNIFSYVGAPEKR